MPLLTARALIWPFDLFCTATSCLLCSLLSLSAHCSCLRLLAQQHAGTSARLLPTTHPIQLSCLEFSSLCAVPCFNILIHTLICLAPFRFPTPPNPFLFSYSAPCLSFSCLINLIRLPPPWYQITRNSQILTKISLTYSDFLPCQTSLVLVFL